MNSYQEMKFFRKVMQIDLSLMKCRRINLIYDQTIYDLSEELFIYLPFKLQSKYRRNKI